VQGQGSVTRLPDVVVARYVGDSMEAASAYFMDAWSIVRPLLTGLVAVRPRIFNT
jgi:urease accessory protein